MDNFVIPRKFTQSAWKMVHFGAFSEADGNVWGERHTGKLRHIKPEILHGFTDGGLELSTSIQLMKSIC